MRKYFDTVINVTNGNPVPGAVVTVTNADGSAVQLYSDNSGTPVSAPINQVLTNAFGLFQFYVANGTYNLNYDFTPGQSVDIKGVQIFEDLAVLNSLGTSITQAPSQAAVQIGLDSKPNSTDLAASSGAALVGFSQSPTAASGTSAAKMQQIVSPTDAPYNAVGNGSNDDTTAVNAALAAVAATGRLFVPPGKRFSVTSLTNSRNVGFDGGGQIATGSGASAFALNDYSRTKGFIVGAEYAYRLYSRIGTSGTTLVGFFAGDSTVARGNTTVTGSITSNVLTVTASGSATLVPGTFLTSVSGTPQIIAQLTGTQFGNGTYSTTTSPNVGAGTINIGNGGGFAGDAGEPQTLLAKLFRNRGVRNSINFANLGIGGTNWSQANVLPYLGTNTDIVFLKYGINHVSGQDVQAEINAMRTVLTNIRAASFGSVSALTVVLIGPSSTSDTAGGRTSVWYEQLRLAYEQAARDFKCVYVDLYGLYQDSTWMANLYMDSIAVHPNGFLQQQLWALIANAIIPAGGTELSTGSDWVTMTGSNSWVPYGNGFAPPQASLSADGTVRLRGAIARGSGTPTGGQLMVSLPNSNYYPPFSTASPCTTFNGSAWSTTHIGVEVSGAIAPRDAAAQNAFVSFDGMSWRVW